MSVTVKSRLRIELPLLDSSVDVKLCIKSSEGSMSDSSLILSILNAHSHMLPGIVQPILMRRGPLLSDTLPRSSLFFLDRLTTRNQREAASHFYNNNTEEDVLCRDNGKIERKVSTSILSLASLKVTTQPTNGTPNEEGGPPSLHPSHTKSMKNFQHSDPPMDSSHAQ
ncbi:hypothetical protein Aperf_G00000101714 [Anoplocephala perfoliata]